MQRSTKPFVNLGKFISKIPTVARPVVRRPVPVNTKAALDAAQKAHYAAEDTKEYKKKQDAVTKTQKKLATASTELKAATVVEAQKKVAMDIVPNYHDKTDHHGTNIIKEHEVAERKLIDAKDDLDQAKKDHQAAKTAIKGGRRRRRHTRPKRRKSKHRRKRQTKKRRKRQTKKRRKRQTKKRRRSRRR